MAKQKSILIGLLLGAGIFSYGTAVSFVDSLNEQQADELIQALKAQGVTPANPEELRGSLQVAETAPRLPQVRYELSPEDFPTPTNSLRQNLQVSETAPRLPQVRYELSPEDFPTPTNSLRQNLQVSETAPRLPQVRYELSPEDFPTPTNSLRQNLQVNEATPSDEDSRTKS